MRMQFPNPAPPQGTLQITVSKAISVIKKAQPDITPQELSHITLPNPVTYYYMFTRKSGPLKGNAYLIDPYSARISPPQQLSSYFIAKVISFHLNLMAGAKGVLASGIFAFFAIFTLLSGLWLWWPSTMRQLKLRLSIKRHAPLRRTLTDLHNIFGISLYLLLLLTTVTTVVMVYNSYTKGGLIKAIDGTTTEKQLSVVSKGKRLPDDVLIARLHQQYPNFNILFIDRPQHATDVLRARFEQKGYGLLRWGYLEMNPYSGNILIDQDSTAPAGQKSMALITDLHAGRFGGIWVKVLYTVTGIMPLGLFITGLLVWWKRKQAERKAKIRRQQLFV